MTDKKRDSVVVRIERSQWELIQQIAEEQERTMQTVTTRILREAFALGLKGMDL